ncbi:flavin reductase family protein [Nocardia kruczakiae]|uniref:flavin reductase family protein n=1 Tax=Nocardia kruczakiae TaxID=261477 RepID=UPI0007A52940|nr:flavin reductase family protein [Nocardia kruczakiae]
MNKSFETDVSPTSLTAPSGPDHLRLTFGCFPTGVIAVCAERYGRPVGMLVSSFTSVSLDPALVSICIMNSSRTWAALREAPRLGLSILGDEQESMCRQLASRAADRFAGVEYERTAQGAVLVPGATAWLDCAPHEEFRAGDHTIVVLAIRGIRAQPGAHPLVFHGSRYRRLVA